MEAVFLLIPLAVILIAIAVAAFIWAVNSGQFDDLDRAASQVLFEDDTPDTDPAEHGEQEQEQKQPSGEPGKRKPPAQPSGSPGHD